MRPCLRPSSSGSDDLVDVEEAVLLEADLDERRLHSGEDVVDGALVDVARDRPALGPLEVHLGDLVVLEDRDSLLGDVDGDDEIALCRRRERPGGRRAAACLAGARLARLSLGLLLRLLGLLGLLLLLRSRGALARLAAVAAPAASSPAAAACGGSRCVGGRVCGRGLYGVGLYSLLTGRLGRSLSRLAPKPSQQVKTPSVMSRARRPAPETGRSARCEIDMGRISASKASSSGFSARKTG